MLVGVPKEIKDNEFRVGIVPSTVRELTEKGHEVLVETGAGAGAGLPDSDYEAAGAVIVADADAVFGKAELVVKVKEPLAVERKKLRKIRSCLLICISLRIGRRPKICCIRASPRSRMKPSPGPQGTLPLLTPMSEVAGRMAPHVGARCLEKDNGGRGVLLGGVPGVSPASVVILGGGVAGTQCGADRLRHGRRRRRAGSQPRSVAPHCGTVQRPRAHVFSTRDVVELLCRRADLVIATVLVPGAMAPKLITRRDGQGDEARLGDRRCRDRSRRLRRNLESDHAFASDLCRRRRRALLRHQHAGRGRAHIDFCIEQRDDLLRARARRQRLARGAAAKMRICARASTYIAAASPIGPSPKRSAFLMSRLRKFWPHSAIAAKAGAWRVSRGGRRGSEQTSIVREPTLRSRRSSARPRPLSHYAVDYRRIE